MISKRLTVLFKTGINEGNSDVFPALEGFIIDFAKELNISISDVLDCLANDIKVSVDKIVKYLKKNKSHLFLNNNVIGYVDGKELKRTTCLTQTGVILRRVARRLGTSHNSNELDHIREVFRERLPFLQ